MMIITKDEATDIVYKTEENPYSIIEVGPWNDQGYYNEFQAIIFKKDDKFYRLIVARQLTDVTLWFPREEHNNVTCEEVKPVEVTTTIWEKV